MSTILGRVEVLQIGIERLWARPEEDPVLLGGLPIGNHVVPDIEHQVTVIVRRLVKDVDEIGRQNLC